MKTYRIGYLAFPWRANPEHADLSYTEQKRGYRVIGGDKGDVRFDGYDVAENETVLHDVYLHSSLDFSIDEAREIAYAIVEESYCSIGAEAVEHS